ncbi:hypothetical protein K7X08_006530 [Anisodus acutangulus]|uniref:SET domain-containing protein n=1 Tax=Anisodus acutangulus TaxID=402998 RepID=A0A9Q1RS27_9SOLA|nr:hypothetical protein K7X08_006530 [Anisodus acutangulus]
MWKSFIDNVMESAKKCVRTRDLICKLSIGENEDHLEVPDIDLFRAEADESGILAKKIDKEKLLNILDVNSLVEELISAKIQGENSDVHGIGLWILASFVNHSCDPNVRRSHVGDHVIIHASRDIKQANSMSLRILMSFHPLGTAKRRQQIGGLFANAKDRHSAQANRVIWGLLKKVKAFEEKRIRASKMYIAAAIVAGLVMFGI